MEKLTHKTDDERRALCLSKGIDPAHHCCLDIAWFISEPVEHGTRPNPVILWNPRWREYRIDISWRGHASTRIRFCPWCGTRLPEPLSDNWYNTLHEMGYDDPGEDDIPSEFNTDQWWRDRHL